MNDWAPSVRFHRNRMQSFAGIAMLQVATLVGIWVRWDVGATLALAYGIVWCATMVSEHGKALRRELAASGGVERPE
jgi:hypothetical protein